MNKVLAFTMLRMHFEGVETFAPVLQTNGTYWLKSANSVLCGARGNEFNFIELATAKAWIDDNFARVAKSGNTAQDFILQLIIQHNASPQAYLQAEIEAIEARNAGDWNIYFSDELVEKFELGYYVLDDSALETVVADYISGNQQGAIVGTRAEIYDIIPAYAQMAYLTDDLVGFFGDGIQTVAQLSPIATRVYTDANFAYKSDVSDLRIYSDANFASKAEVPNDAHITQLAEAAFNNANGYLTEGTNQILSIAVQRSSWAHNLPSQPDFVQVFLMCIMPQYGYAAGDMVAPLSSANLSTWYSNTQTGLSMSTAALTIVKRDVAGATGAITAANWRLLVKSFKYAHE